MAATNRRILAKTISWRVVSTSTTFLLTFMLTGNYWIASQLAAINVVLKTLMQFMHEKAWQNVDWGKKKWLKKKRKQKKKLAKVRG